MFLIAFCIHHSALSLSHCWTYTSCPYRKDFLALEPYDESSCCIGHRKCIFVVNQSSKYSCYFTKFKGFSDINYLLKILHSKESDNNFVEVYHLRKNKHVNNEFSKIFSCLIYNYVISVQELLPDIKQYIKRDIF